MTFKKVVAALKWLWLILIFAVIGLYLLENYASLREHLKSIALSTLILSSVALLAARTLLPELARYALYFIGVRLPYSRMFYITSLSLLARYLPGGIWHFVGQAGFYRADGLTVKQITRALLLENVWLVASATFVGLIFFALAQQAVFIAALTLALWIALMWLVNRLYAERWSWLALAMQAATWVLFGVSFWLLTGDGTLWAASIGAFCLSFAVGFVAVFAPSGIGVREAVLVVLLGSVLPPGDIVVLAAVHRLLWTATELMMGIIARSLAYTPPVGDYA